MTKPLHLTDEALLEMATTRLSQDDQRSVEEHLASCQKCSDRYQQILFARSAFLRVADLGLTQVTELPTRSFVGIGPGAVAFPWKPVSAILFGCLCGIALLFSGKIVPTASAAELLSNAVRYEIRAGDAKALRVQVSGRSCAVGQANDEMVSFENSDRCSLALREIKKTPWGHGSPLSAKTFLAWRNSLRRHRDQVEKKNASWMIKTTTDEEPVRTASLELRSSDYHAMQLTLDFTNSEEISISEEVALPPIAPLEPVSDIALKKTVTELQPHVDNPIDLLEVQAWVILHRINADSGWEAIVRRNGHQVQIRAIVKDEARRQELLTAFAEYHDIALDVHLLMEGGDYAGIFPDRVRPTGNDPGIAEGWLEQQFPESSSRTRFSNSVLSLSQQIFGRAYIIDELGQRQLALKHCACVKHLSDLIANEKLVLSGLQSDLHQSLEPLIGADTHLPIRPLTLAEARDLDMVLESLFSASTGRDDSLFVARVQKIRSVL